MNGVEATRQIVNRNPDTAVVILSMHKDESYVIRSLKAGARAYLLKDSAEADLIAAIQSHYRRQVLLQPRRAEPLERRLHATSSTSSAPRIATNC